MGLTLPAAVKAVLASPNVRIVKQVELIREYWNADLRLIVDVSSDVAKYGDLVNESTLKKVDWQVAHFTVSMKNTTGKYSPEKATSIWKATFARTPRQCALIYRHLLPMPDGTLYELNEYKGEISDCVPREESDMAVVDIVTKHLSHGPLTAKLTKSSGDELVVLGTTW